MSYSVRRCSPGGSKDVAGWGYHECLKLQFAREAGRALRIFFTSHYLDEDEEFSTDEEVHYISSFRETNIKSDDNDVKDGETFNLRCTEEKQIIKAVLTSTRELLDVVGPWVSDHCLADVIASAEVIARKSQMEEFQVSSFWRLPSGVSSSELEASRHKAHGFWTAGLISMNSTVLESETRLEDFNDFVAKITHDPKIIAQAAEDVVAVAEYIDCLPVLSDRAELGDLRYELVIPGLVQHIRSSMRSGSIRRNRSLDSDNTVLASWVSDGLLSYVGVCTLLPVQSSWRRSSGLSGGSDSISTK